MKNFKNKIFSNHSLIYKIFLLVITTISIIYLFPKGGQFKYEFREGKPWQYENYYAPFDFAILKSEDEIKAEKDLIKQNLKPYYRNKVEVINAVAADYNNKITLMLEDPIFANAHKKELENFGRTVIDEIYNIGYLDANSTSFQRNNEIMIITNNTANDQILNQLINKQTLHDKLIFYLKDAKYNLYADKFSSFLIDILKPNLFYDKNLNEKALEDAYKNISLTKGFISEKERIILKGDVVEGKNFEILNSLKKEFESQLWSKSNYNWIVLGYTILVALAMLMLLLFLHKYRIEIYDNNKKVTFIFSNVLLMVLLTTLMIKFKPDYVYIVPLVILPLILKAFFDARLGLFAHVLTILLLGFIVPNSFEFIFLQIIAGIVTILTVSELYKRANLFISVSQITLVYFLSYFAFSVTKDGNASHLELLKFELFIFNGVLTLFVLPLMFFYEKVFGLVSDETLRELSDSNSKLLRELAEKAPGTFQHSMQVANLAEASASEIRANAMLVRTGALYHDIGKMFNPMYFTENQSTSVNPHFDLSPKDSAKIIISHVIKGIELAKKNNLPDRIIDFIRTHHGTSLTYYFYKLEEDRNIGDLNPEDFRYPGPIPFSKETAILMMCDACEAASKSLKIPTGKSIDELVEKIINGQMEQKQFMNADITFKQIETIKKVIKKKLKNIYYLRISYPE
ncbi:MAG: phosphohydrolase [Flavobacteriales bacterium CG_4_8_14_3_um_filter_35_10]|nr:MAG: phosphohydrolase [Flavobacteriales bacterium CG_4_8_14_3_um_filter_35_10]